MTVIQLLVLGIGGVSLLISAELVRSVVRERWRSHADVSPGFRRVGSFGGVGSIAGTAEPLPSTGSAGNAWLFLIVLAAFLGTCTVVKFAWEEANPDLRSAYGRAYERCVREEKISRWNVEAVERCVNRSRSSWQ